MKVHSGRFPIQRSIIALFVVAALAMIDAVMLPDAGMRRFGWGMMLMSIAGICVAVGRMMWTALQELRADQVAHHAECAIRIGREIDQEWRALDQHRRELG